jgi:DNA-binding transcriptional regulator YdaS (Cro superfamily)
LYSGGAALVTSRSAIRKAAGLAQKFAELLAVARIDVAQPGHQIASRARHAPVIERSRNRC